MVERLYLAYTRADAEWLVSHPELLKTGEIVYSGIEAHLVFQSAKIPAQDAVKFYLKLDFCTITTEVDNLRDKFEQICRQVSPDYGLSLIYRDIDVLSCSVHLLYYFFYEAITSYHLAVAILQKYKPKEIWVNQLPLTPVTQWGLAPPPQTNYENQVWGAMRNKGFVIKPLEIPNTLESSPSTVKLGKLIYKSQYQHWQPQNSQKNTWNKSINSLESEVLLALQRNFTNNYAPIGQALANSFNLKTLDLNEGTFCSGWYGESSSVPVPLTGDVGALGEVEINQLLNDHRFYSGFWDYPLDIWRIVQPRVDLLWCFDIPIVRSWIDRAYWVLKEVRPKLIVMAEEVSLPARTLGKVAQLQGIKKLVVEHGAPISFDPRISGKERSYLYRWQQNYGETTPDYVAVWGAYAQRYYVESLGWLPERVIPTGWPWIEREIREHLSSEKTKVDDHAELRLLFLSTSTYKFSNYLYETLFEAAKYFGSKLVIRPHGTENTIQLDELACHIGVNIKIDNASALLQQIEESDIVLGAATSVLSYAIALGKPCIFVDLLGLRDFMPYALEGAAIGVYDREELIPAIEKLLNDCEERHRQQEKQKVFTQQYLGPFDGKATERIINFVKTKVDFHNNFGSSSSTDYLKVRSESDMLRVDIGCGTNKPANFTGVDIYPGVGVDIVADISKEFPFPDSSVDELRAHDIIEHLPERIHTMNEIWRVCKPGAKVDIRVPSTDGRGAFQDPTHISFWNINSFLYYCNEFPAYIELCRRYGFKGEFKALKLEHEESADGVVHVLAELLVVKPVSNSIPNQILGNDFKNNLEYRQENNQKVNTEVVDKQEFFSLLSIYAQQYQQDPTERSAIANLRQARYQIAAQWLTESVNQLESIYAGELGRAHQILLGIGIRNESLTATEQTFLDEVITNISRGFDEPKALQYLLAAMLYRRADQLPLPQDFSRIPPWLLNDYLKFLFASPPNFQEVGEADNYYHYMQRWIDYLHASILSEPDSLLWHEVVTQFVPIANFIPLYFNETNLKNIYFKRAEIIEFFLKLKGYEVDYEFADRSVTRKKIRLGILAAHFTPTAETFATLSAYEYISRDFEVILYPLTWTNNSLEQYCQSCANSVKLLPKDLVDQVNYIRADDLDILLIATNVTAVTNPLCLLSLHRLARVQVTSVSSVVTTGMRHVDYYISGKLTDALITAEEHYTEKLVKLEGTAQCFSYGHEQQQVNIKVDRESLGISEETVVFTSGANFFKITPELIDTWAKIIAAVPNSVLLLLPFGPNWSNAYPKKAFFKHINTKFEAHRVTANRLMILDPQPVPNLEEVKEYFKIADIYLDSYPFSGTSSLIEPLDVNLPIIARQGTCFRSTMGAAMLQALGVPDLVADSEESYIQSAIALGKNPELRKDKSKQIQQKMQGNPSFLDSRAYSAQMGSVFQELFRKYLAENLSNNLNFREINLIIFPDWNQPEELLCLSLASVISAIASHHEKSQITLLIDTSNLADQDYANLALSSVAMNLLMEEDVDVTEGPEISLIENLGQLEWKALLTKVYGRVALEQENHNAIARIGAENIPLLELNSLNI
ncbi:MAG TPA: methyltransferase domain-containing protein [Oculatellaceae cyanobacterium]|jgi:predicted O-linked N-acetylglucosamine transferase (SPINDLY family)